MTRLPTTLFTQPPEYVLVHTPPSHISPPSTSSHTRQPFHSRTPHEPAQLKNQTTPKGHHHRTQRPVPPSIYQFPPPPPRSPLPEKKQQPCSTEAPVMMYRLHWSAQALMNRVAFRRLMPGQHLMLLPGHRQCKTKQTSILLRKCRSPRTLDLWWLRIPNGLASVWLSDPPFPPPALPPPPLPLRQVS